MAHDPLSLLDATAQSDLVRRGEVSPTELVDAALARIDRLDPALGAVVHRRDERARAEALDPGPGPFRGVPMLVKDAVCTMAGEPYHFGMRFLAERGYVAPVDTELVRRFRQAGFVIVGRTKTPELACSAVTEPMIQGPARNPWDLGRSPGGSSGGSGAAVASGMVAVAHGNDMGGSIRIPAALCGLVGLKPTRGRTTLAPRYEIWGPLSHEHVLTRSVRDTAAVLDAVCGPFPGDLTTAPPPTGSYAAEVGADPGRLRIGVCVTAAGNAPVDPAWCEAARAAGRLLESLGHHVEEVDGALDGTGLETGMGAVIAAGLARECHLLGLAVGQPVPLEELEPMNASLVARGRAMSALELQEAVELLADQSRALTRLWVDRVDVLVTPTSAAPAPVVDELGPLAPPERLFPGLGDLTRFTAPWNVTGQPAISLPLGTDALGMPVGVQLVGAFGRDDLIIRLAAQLEAAAPWADRRPPTHA